MERWMGFVIVGWRPSGVALFGNSQIDELRAEVAKELGSVDASFSPTMPVLD
jgi:hypothetical protein